MYKKILVALFILCFALPACAKRQSEEIITPLTQLQKRQYQTRTFNSGDSTAVMKGVLNVLQDEGYIVYNVNSLLGFIYGVKDFDTTDPNVDISKEFGLTKSRLNYNGVKVATLEVAANVTEYPQNVRIRVNFKRKLLNEYGNAQFIDDVDDAEFYDEFYKKLDSAIALQKGTTVKKMPAIENIPVTNPPKVEQVPVAEGAPAIEEPKTEVNPQLPAKTIKESSAKEPEQMKEEKGAPQAEEEQINKEDAKLEKKRAKEEAKALKEQEKLEKELEKEKEKQAKEQAKIEKELNKIYQ